MTKLQVQTVLVVVLLMSISSVQGSEVENRIEKPVQEAIATRKMTQESEEQWRQERSGLENKLAALEIEVSQLTDNRDQLRKQVAATKKRISDKQQQLADIERIAQEMSPFLVSLTAKISTLPGRGLPFLPKERQQRVEKLVKLINDPDVEVSEQYRKAMEALLVEAEYGLTIETYQQEIGVADQKLLANIFRLGRLGLYYQSLDGADCGFFNVASSQWQPFDTSYTKPIETAIAIAAKQRPAELITMPLGRMVGQ